ncbi:hypothetical protein RND71_018676 [Anisodus tanguticus]|uniref:Uncharacterized protein n=1 Tax=Anisodus tanguticus TaxID=243964 RepID=A0AAE1S4N6_9SOLA|nr:hypothetical protein RND71_018676 [Anisodus tanguticus]
MDETGEHSRLNVKKPTVPAGGLSETTSLPPMVREIMSSSRGNSLLQKCEVRLRTIDPYGDLKFVAVQVTG